LIYILFVLRLFVRLGITAAKSEPAPLIEFQGSQELQTRNDCNMPALIVLTIATKATRPGAEPFVSRATKGAIDAPQAISPEMPSRPNSVSARSMRRRTAVYEQSPDSYRQRLVILHRIALLFPRRFFSVGKGR